MLNVVCLSQQTGLSMEKRSCRTVDSGSHRTA